MHEHGVLSCGVHSDRAVVGHISKCEIADRVRAVPDRDGDVGKTGEVTKLGGGKSASLSLQYKRGVVRPNFETKRNEGGCLWLLDEIRSRVSEFDVYDALVMKESKFYALNQGNLSNNDYFTQFREIGRASCRERV